MQRKANRVFLPVGSLASVVLVLVVEVDLLEIRRQLPRLSGHLAIRGLFLLVIAWFAIRDLHMSWQPAALFALGLLTPSTAFILDTLPESGLEASEQTEVSIDTISGEITALFVLFIVSQAGSIRVLASSALVLTLLIVLTPFLFLFLGKYVVPYAPGSEFSLLLMVGIICTVITQNLGVHYLMWSIYSGTSGWAAS